MNPTVWASIPSPSQSVWYLGPFPLRAYALCIILGIVVAGWLTAKRIVHRGGTAEQVFDVSFIAVIFGIIGGRLYHVISSPRAYFGEGGDPIKALYIWEGGLGIWGAIALGAVGAWIGCKRVGLRFSAYADAIAPGLLIAQAIGRLGNWFNQELFGGPTTLPWGLEIDDRHLPAGFESGTLFHPTFLYELLWCLAAAAVILWLDKKRDFKPGQVMWLYVMLYTMGRLWIEALRIDDAELILGLRLNIWTSIIIFIVGLVGFVVAGKRNNQINEKHEDETQEPLDAEA
ncbi:prolipoprotein diacylglyceryl transferase [Populibacterium corticicola]|uniref:Phosphatidylglycerol--prolipoprotein diacylglyceryl transferase n=1 Tax=Populibacterium corticicola TaxID=1812826 RepID=A0ABW5XCN7_9MICO